MDYSLLKLARSGVIFDPTWIDCAQTMLFCLRTGRKAFRSKSGALVICQAPPPVTKIADRG